MEKPCEEYFYVTQCHNCLFCLQDGRTLGDTWLEAKGKRPIEGNPVTIGPVISSYQGKPDPPPNGVFPVQCHLVNDMTLTTRV